MDSLELTGDWWLPEASDTRLSGTLSFDPTSSMGSLRLNGQLFDVVDFGLTDPKQIPILLGEVDGVAYTLKQCYAVYSHLYLYTNLTDIHVMYIFKGQHFNAIEDIVFDSITVSYPSLDEWIDHERRKVRANQDESDRDRIRRLARGKTRMQELEFLVTNVPFQPVEFHSVDAFGTQFDFKLTRRLPHKDESPAEWKSRARLTITPSKALPFFGGADQSDFAQLILFRFSDFLTLATGRINDPQSIQGTVSGSDSARSVSLFRSTLEPEFGYYMQPLFALDDVKDNLSKFLSNWIALYLKLGEVLDLYFRWNHDLYHGRLYHTSTQFLNMARALEAYHRRLYDKPYIDPAEYKSKKKKVMRVIRETFCTEFSEKLIQDLAYGNMYSFAKRLESICYEVLVGFTDVFGEVLGDLNDFKRTVADTRNDLTHVLEKPGEYAINRDDLKSYHEYVTKMRILLRMCLLLEMDFPPDLVKRLITENREHEKLM